MSNILPIKLCKPLLGYLLLPLLSALTNETEYSFQSIFLCVSLKEKVNIACHLLLCLESNVILVDILTF